MIKVIRLIMRKEECQLCEKPGVTIMPFFRYGCVDPHRGYVFCSECKGKGDEYFAKINENCKSLISKETEKKFDEFDFRTIGWRLINKKLKLVLHEKIIDASFYGSEFNDENDDFYVVLSYKLNGEFYSVPLTFKDFLKLNKDWF